MHPSWGALNAHVVDLAIVAFFFLLRPGEYCYTGEKDTRSSPFLFQDIYLTIGGKVYCGPTAPLNDQNDVSRITYAVLQFRDQKNAVRGEQVGHAATSDPFYCPAKALGRICLRLLQSNAAADTPIYRVRANGAWHTAKSLHISRALKHSANLLYPITGISSHLLSARSLRPGGATALLCAGIDSDSIALLGRWKSDAMLRYLRVQAASHVRNFAQSMVDHGSYTFAPTAFQAGGLPQQAPPSVAALLAHDELYATT